MSQELLVWWFQSTKKYDGDWWCQFESSQDTEGRGTTCKTLPSIPIYSIPMFGCMKLLRILQYMENIGKLSTQPHPSINLNCEVHLSSASFCFQAAAGLMLAWHQWHLRPDLRLVNPRPGSSKLGCWGLPQFPPHPPAPCHVATCLGAQDEKC